MTSPSVNYVSYSRELRHINVDNVVTSSKNGDLFMFVITRKYARIFTLVSYLKCLYPTT